MPTHMGDLDALHSLEECGFRRVALDDGTERSRQDVAVDVIPEQIILGAELDGPPGEVLVGWRTEDQDWEIGCGPKDTFDARET